jgi:tRNA nucleotidyltransferase (CCA-adding enzyme)
MYNIPAPAKTALSVLRRAGHEAYFVGGCVRDLLLGKTPQDWDIATGAAPEESLAAFAGCKVIRTGFRHGTVTVLIDGEPIEVTTFREDAGYSDHRRPDSVTFTKTLDADVARRDFTVNALALDPETGVIDRFGGMEDLAAGLIRCVGNPGERFAEDGLRILRALRFSSVLNFNIEPETAAAIHAHKHLLQSISPERITAELTKLLCGENAGDVLREYADVLCVPIPELGPVIGSAQNNEHHCRDVWRNTAAAVENSEPAAILRWAALLHAVGGQMADAIMRRLRFDNATRKKTATLVAHHDMPIPNDERAVKRYLNRFGEGVLRDLLSMRRATGFGGAPASRYSRAELDAVRETLEEILAEGVCFSLRDLAVNGNDLLACGMEGKEIGKALDFLLNAVIDGQVENERGALLRRLENRRG